MKKAKIILYVLGLLFIIIPVCVVIFSDYMFSFTNIRILSGAAFFLIIAGNVLSAILRNADEKPIWLNLGLSIGLVIVFIFLIVL